jgi:hypothetical protein
MLFVEIRNGKTIDGCRATKGNKIPLKGPVTDRNYGNYSRARAPRREGVSAQGSRAANGGNVEEGRAILYVKL